MTIIQIKLSLPLAWAGSVLSYKEFHTGTGLILGEYQGYQMGVSGREDNVGGAGSKAGRKYYWGGAVEHAGADRLGNTVASLLGEVCCERSCDYSVTFHEITSLCFMYRWQARRPRPGRSRWPPRTRPTSPFSSSTPLTQFRTDSM